MAVAHGWLTLNPDDLQSLIRTDLHGADSVAVSVPAVKGSYSPLSAKGSRRKRPRKNASLEFNSVPAVLFRQAYRQINQPNSSKCKAQKGKEGTVAEGKELNSKPSNVSKQEVQQQNCKRNSSNNEQRPRKCTHEQDSITLNSSIRIDMDVVAPNPQKKTRITKETQGKGSDVHKHANACIFKYPTTPAERARYHVFCDLWER